MAPRLPTCPRQYVAVSIHTDDAMSPPTAGLQRVLQQPQQPERPVGGSGGTPQRHPSPLRMAPLESQDTMQLPPGGLWILAPHASAATAQVDPALPEVPQKQ